ncbi:DMT family transporter [Solirhodobacter olei]|uniref:DMT family transporter n=1 Tax=Solirhodobacter olei TaxID=2493082 RepID=UPI000FD83D79|nr:DMT family transporter [Solirhodobacter olei]
MRPLRGIAMKIASVTLFMVMSTLIKMASERVPAGEAVFFRASCAMPVILVWLVAQGEFPAGLRVTSPFGHVLRGLLGTTAMGLGFAGLAFLPLSEVVAIGYAAPLLTVVFAALLLGEQVRLFRIATVGLGLVGVVIVAAPKLSGLFGHGDARSAIGATVVLVGAVFAALAQVWVRRLVQREKVSAIVFYFSLSATVLSFLTLPWGWVMPTPAEAAMLVTAGIFGGVGQILLTSSYREADASLIAPFEYSSMILALGLGYMVFAEIPDADTLTGAAIIVAAGLIIIWRERQLGLERTRQRRAMSPGGR